MMHSTDTKRVSDFIHRISVASPRLQRLLSTARITAVDAPRWRSAPGPELARHSELSPGVGRQPLHLVLLDDSNEGVTVKNQLGFIQEVSDFFTVPVPQVILMTQNEAFSSHSNDSSQEPSVNWSVFNRQFHTAIQKTKSPPSLDQS